MKRQRWFLLGLIVWLVFSQAPGAVASNSFLDMVSAGFVYQNDYEGHIYILHESASGGAFNQLFDLTPTEAGLFSQQVFLNTSFYAFGMSKTRGLSSEEHPSSYYSYMGANGPTGVNYEIALNQSGPLRFADLTWEGKLLQEDGSQTTLFTLSANADLIANGGSQSGSAPFDYGWVDIRVFVDSCWFIDYGGGDGYWTTTYSTPLNELTFRTVILSVTGHVIDPPASAPVPSGLLLVGSGLVPLALYRREKLDCRN